MNLMFESNLNEIFFVPFIVAASLLLLGVVVIAAAPNDKVATVGSITAIVAMISVVVFLVGATLIGTDHRQKNITQVRSEVEQVYGVDISESNAEKIVEAIESELFFTDDLIVLDGISLLVDETPVYVDLVYVDGEYHFYVNPSTLDNQSVELSRR